MGGKKGKKSTVGFRYYTTLHFAVCHGEVDAIRAVWWSDKVAWSGTQVPGTEGTARWSFDAGGLFGGEMSEGGASGVLEAGFGSRDQTMFGVLPDGTYDPVKMAGPRQVVEYDEEGNREVTVIPAPLGVQAPSHPSMAINYRGLCVLFMHDNWIGNNAYIKELSVEVERYWKGWRPSLARIGDNMNPAHIIYECLTNEEWGLGYPVSVIDDAAFTAAAQTLFNEGFGLSFIWDSDRDIYGFVDQVRTCIEASFYLNRRSGLWTIKLIRAGDTPKLTLDSSNCRLESFSRKAIGETFNELSVQWTNPASEEYETITVQDIANIEAQGRVLQTEKEYIGVRTQELANKLAQRDLQSASAQLSAAEVVCNRAAWELMPGDTVTFNWPPLGISGLIMRVVETSQEAPGSDTISLQLAEDIYGRASGNFSGVQPPGWVDPSGPPVLFTYTNPWEFPYFYVAQYVDAATVSPEVTYATAFGAGGTEAAKQVRLFSWVTTENGPAWTLLDIGVITPFVKTAALLPKELSSSVVVDTSTAFRVLDAQQDSFVLITDGIHQEIGQISGMASGGEVVVTRGLMDTHPRQWPVGTELWFIGRSMFVEPENQRSTGELARFKVSMQTNEGFMPYEDVPEDTLLLSGRHALPYPPANITIAGTYWPTEVEIPAGSFNLPVDWSTRNRLLQDSPVQVLWSAASISPEDNTTYVAELWQGGALKATSGEVTGTHADIPLSGLSTGGYLIKVYSLRDGYRNYIDFEHTLQIGIASSSGYGNSYGYGYGL